jgi:hypothetical protein
MTPYQLWQLEKYGNILPETKPLYDEDEVREMEADHEEESD